MNDERGIALPLVLGVMVLMFLLVTATLSLSLQARHSAVTDWQMLRAQYAAESGIARMQGTICDQGTSRTITMQMNGMDVTTQSEIRSGQGMITSTAIGQGVKQTIRVRVDLRTCTVTRWERGRE